MISVVDIPMALPEFQIILQRQNLETNVFVKHQCSHYNVLIIIFGLILDHLTSET